MRVALLYPYKKKHYIGCNPPISILYLAAAVRQAGKNVMVIDMDNGNLSIQKILEKVLNYSPDLIGMPLFSSYLSSAHQLTGMLAEHKPRWKLLLGGPHASARAREVLESFVGCDYVLRGESEEGIVELIEMLDGKRDPSSVKGLSYRENGKILNNPDRLLNMDLDTILFPARDLLADAYRNGVYWRWGHRGTTDVIITSRGCPYSCNFCFKVSKKFRLRSPENIIEELVAIRSMGIKNVHIMDDLFVWNKERCLKILDMIKLEKLNMEFKVRARVDLVDEELLAALKSAGTTSIVYGIESGSQKILDLINKRTTVEMNYKIIRMTKKVGLQCYADMFIGYPGETIETIRASEELILKAKPTGVNLSVMYPLPDTKVYNEAKENGTLRDDWNVNGSQAWIKLPWVQDRLTLYKYRDRMLKKYLHKPKVILNVIKFSLFKIDMIQFRYMMSYFVRFAIKH